MVMITGKYSSNDGTSNNIIATIEITIKNNDNNNKEKMITIKKYQPEFHILFHQNNFLEVP